MPVLMNRLTLELVTDTETHHHWCPVCQMFWEHEGEYDGCPYKRVQACPLECSEAAVKGRRLINW